MKKNIRKTTKQLIQDYVKAIKEDKKLSGTHSSTIEDKLPKEKIHNIPSNVLSGNNVSVQEEKEHKEKSPYEEIQPHEHNTEFC